MQTFNIKIEDRQKQIKTIWDPYKNSLNNLLDSNINNIVDSTNFYLIKQTISTTQSKMLCNISLLSEFSSKVVSSNSKNSSFFAKKIHYPSCRQIFCQKSYSNLLFKLFNKDSGLKKEKVMVIIIF